MALISNIIRKAATNIGMQITEDEAVPSDILDPMFELLKDVVSELNTQTAISFGQEATDITVSGNLLTFMPYTEAEQAIIDGGGTVDITDRLVDFIPMTSPTVYFNGYSLPQLSVKDILNLRSGSCVTSVAFNVKSDRSELLFDGNVASTISILRNIPILIDDAPYGNVDIPEPYVTFLVMKLSELGAGHFQFYEKAQFYTEKSKTSASNLSINNLSHKPITHNIYLGLNKFRRYG